MTTRTYEVKREMVGETTKVFSYHVSVYEGRKDGTLKPVPIRNESDFTPEGLAMKLVHDKKGFILNADGIDTITTIDKPILRGDITIAPVSVKDLVVFRDAFRSYSRHAVVVLMCG